MKYVKQFGIILLFSLAGDLCHRLLPFPIPASIYGMVLLFLALCIGLVKLEQVKDAAHFLTSILPILFVAPAVGIVEYWELVSDNLIPIILLILATTVLTFGISGTVVQRFMKKGGKDGE